MKIALVGYGAMGKQIESILLESTHEIVSVTCKEIGDELQLEQLHEADVAIDFSSGALIHRHIGLYCQANVPAVIGTTGWDAKNKEIIKLVEASGIGIMVGSNFSAGLQTFLQVLRISARQFASIGEYDVYGHEIHHTNKADSPSGTAKTICETIVSETPTKTQVEFDRPEGRITPETLHFGSIRGGVHAGLHEVTFASDADSVTLSHDAHSRSGFARGAISAAEYVQNRTGYMCYEELFKKGGPYEINL